MGKMSANLWDRVVDKFNLDKLINDAICSKNDERSVMMMLKLMLACGDLSTALAVPPITGHRFEFTVPGGRIDLLLFHIDKSVTIVEAKAENGANTIAAGIGQLCIYAAALPSCIARNGDVPVIRRVLCAHVQPDKAVNLISACNMAGVKYAFIPSHKTFKKHFELLFARHNYGKKIVANA
jgi:hypothetical protein